MFVLKKATSRHDPNFSPSQTLSRNHLDFHTSLRNMGCNLFFPPKGSPKSHSNYPPALSVHFQFPQGPYMTTKDCLGGPSFLEMFRSKKKVRYTNNMLVELTTHVLLIYNVHLQDQFWQICPFELLFAKMKIRYF